MGVNSRRRHAERMIKRAAPGLVPKPMQMPTIKAPRIKRSFKVVAIFGWAFIGSLWLVWWVRHR